MSCNACRLPGPLDEPHTIFLWPPTAHGLAKIADHLTALGHDHERETAAGFIRLTVADPGHLVDALDTLLTERERLDTRCLLSREPDPGLGAFGDVASVDEIVGRVRADWLIRLLGDGRYLSVRQPIVRLDGAGNDAVGHEYLFRGLDEAGAQISPATLFDAARDPRILFNLDRTARISAVETAARSAGDGLIFINFMPGSVYDPDVCLRTTVDAAAAAGVSPERVVFEIVESERIADHAHLRAIADFYRNAGFRIALDDYGAGFNNLSTLLQLEPDFVKMDKSLIQEIAVRASQQDVVGTLTAQCARAGIATIGEGVEDAETAALLHELGVPYAQGYHFGKPAAPQAADAASTS